MLAKKHLEKYCFKFPMCRYLQDVGNNKYHCLKLKPEKEIIDRTVEEFDNISKRYNYKFLKEGFPTGDNCEGLKK